MLKNMKNNIKYLIFNNIYLLRLCFKQNHLVLVLINFSNCDFTLPY
jgi:hypothetical protein